MAGHEDGQHQPAVEPHHECEDEEIDKGEQDVHGVSHQETLYPSMVTYTLQDVAGLLGVEEAQGLPHEICQELGDERHVNACVDVQHNPASEKAYYQLGHEQHELCEKDGRDEVKISLTNAHVHHGLCQEGEGQLDDGTQQHAHQNLSYQHLVRKEITGIVAQRSFSRSLLFLLHLIEPGGGLQQQGQPKWIPLAVHGALPAVQELRFFVCDQLRGGVRYVVEPAFPALAADSSRNQTVIFYHKGKTGNNRKR